MTTTTPHRGATRKRQTSKPSTMDELELSRSTALRVADILADTPASDTVVMDIHSFSSLADYFLVTSGDNERQVKAIMQEIVEKMSEDGIRPRRVEGVPNAGWVVLDYGDLIIHVFERKQREYYGLEDLWEAAPRLLSIQ